MRPSSATRRVAAVEVVQDFEALLAGAAVDVAEQVHAGRHRVVERADRRTRPSGRRRSTGPAGRGRRRRRGSAPAAWASARRREFTADHQPDHLREADRADQFLDGVPVEADARRARCRRSPVAHQSAAASSRSVQDSLCAPRRAVDLVGGVPELGQDLVGVFAQTRWAASVGPTGAPSTWTLLPSTRRGASAPASGMGTSWSSSRSASWSRQALARR